MKLTIDRNIWLRGELGNSLLLRKRDGKMCCVGIWLEAIGCPREQLEGLGTAYAIKYSDLTNPLEIPEWALNTSDISSLYETNDYPASNDKDREKEIARIFAKHDVEVTFIN